MAGRGDRRAATKLARPAHVMIVEARFYEDIAEELALGAVREIEKAGASYERIEVPGAFEIPAAIAFTKLPARSPQAAGRFDGYVALGCVIRGETTHYDYVCGESARGLQDLALRERLAIGYGILTVDTKKQAWARARRDRGNKGGDAARACLAMIELRRRLAAKAK